MKCIVLAVLTFFILFAINPAFGQSVDSAKEAIEKVKKDREADLAKRQAQKDKAAAENNHQLFPHTSGDSQDIRVWRRGLHVPYL